MKYNEDVVRQYYVSQGLPEPVFEYRHIPDRKFRLDVAFIAHKVGVEIQGGLWLPISGHKSGVHIKRDYEKMNLSILNGWLVLQIEPKEVCLLETIDKIKRLIASRK